MTFQAFHINRGRHTLPRKTAESEAQSSSSDHSDAPTFPGDIAQAMSVLGVKPRCTADEVVAAYRHMAQMYHPDKTSGLGPELQKLADERMRTMPRIKP